MASPGRSQRKGITLLQPQELFQDEATATKWFETVFWPDGRKCPHCNGDNTYGATGKRMPYRCRPCERYFSVRSGTILQASNLPLKTCVHAIYIEMTSLNGASSMKLHRDLGIRQATTWHLHYRIRTAFLREFAPEFAGPVEVDEAYFGGKEKNKLKPQKLTICETRVSPNSKWSYIAQA